MASVRRAQKLSCVRKEPVSASNKRDPPLDSSEPDYTSVTVDLGKEKTAAQSAAHGEEPTVEQSISEGLHPLVQNYIRSHHSIWEAHVGSVCEEQHPVEVPGEGGRSKGKELQVMKHYELTTIPIPVLSVTWGEEVEDDVQGNNV